MSPRFGTPGKRCFRTSQGNGSISLNQTGSQPSGIHAREAASTPEQTLAYLISPSLPARGFPPRGTTRRAARNVFYVRGAFRVRGRRTVPFRIFACIRGSNTAPVFWDVLYSASRRRFYQAWFKSSSLTMRSPAAMATDRSSIAPAEFCQPGSSTITELVRTSSAATFR